MATLEEIFKLSHQVPASQIVEVKGRLSAGFDEQINDLRNNKHSRLQSPTSQCREPLIPPCFGIQLSEESGETSIPPSFEAINTIELSPVQKEKALKRYHELTGKRMTRSQAKQNKESTVRSQKILSRFSSGKGSKEGSP